MPAPAVRVCWAYAKAFDGDALTASDQEQTARLVRPSDRALHATSRVLRRTILATETGCAGHDLRFASSCPACGSTDHGPPTLISDRAEKVHFSVSHAGNVALIAVSHAVAVGVDVERERPPAVWLEIAGHVAHHQDDPTLRAVEVWTAKEAALKLTGFGLSIPMRAVMVQRVGGSDGHSVVEHEGRRYEASVSWFRIDANHCGAVATAVPAAVNVSRAYL